MKNFLGSLSNVLYNLTGKIRAKEIKDLTSKCDVIEKDIPKCENVSNINSLYNSVNYSSGDSMNDNQLKNSAKNIKDDLDNVKDENAETWKWFKNTCKLYDGFRSKWESLKSNGINSSKEYSELSLIHI